MVVRRSKEECWVRAEIAKRLLRERPAASLRCENAALMAGEKKIRDAGKKKTETVATW